MGTRDRTPTWTSWWCCLLTAKARKSLEILNRVDPDLSVDLLARRPEDTARRYEEGDPMIREALDHGKGAV
jgi:hypothetical protein